MKHKHDRKAEQVVQGEKLHEEEHILEDTYEYVIKRYKIQKIRVKKKFSQQ